MDTNDDRPGLLSKVITFVRNPVRDRLEIGHHHDVDGSNYVRQSLMFMIGRKRKNDLVRKLEFDQLRKLRKHHPDWHGSRLQASVSQPDLSVDGHENALQTRKKKAAWEPQMSRHWAQKGLSQPHHLQQSSASLASDGTAKPLGEANASVRHVDAAVAWDGLESRAFANTKPLLLHNAEEEDARASAPELAEAAIRYANGDVAGAEHGLLSVLRGTVLTQPTARCWIDALLDMYLASGNSAGVYRLQQEFALHLKDYPPSRFAFGARQQLASVWLCPACLTAADVQQLHAHLVSQTLPSLLNWTELQEIVLDAMEPLNAWLEALCCQKVQLHFAGTESLLRTLSILTPSGNRSAERIGWTLRLNLLRSLGLRDEFDLLALDYCITYESAPAEWQDAGCQLEWEDAVPRSATSSPSTLTVQQQAAASDCAPAEVVFLSLAGELLGTTSLVLPELDPIQCLAQRIVIDCQSLVRVDFLATGSILEWVVQRHAEGKEVEFVWLPPLVATFFKVMGIRQYAKVNPPTA